MNVRSHWLAAIVPLLALLVIFGCGGSGGGTTGTTSSTTGDPLPPGQKGKWTVMVYMNAANDLYSFSTLNMNQIENITTNSQVRYVVQWKQSTDLFSQSTFNGTRRYIAYPDPSDLSKPNPITSHLLQDMGTGIDMGIPSTLHEFVTWAKSEYPADHYALVIWNHGNGWERSVDDGGITRGVSYDDQTGNAIQIWQLEEALGGTNLDMIAYDASLMQMAEVAYEMKGLTPLVIGSEESPPGAGYPYNTVFKPFSDTPDMSPRDLSKSFVDGMVNNPDYVNRKITQSVLDSSKLSDLGVKASALANLLFLHPEENDAIVAARTATQAYSPVDFRHYFDLYDFCVNLKSRVAASDLKSACDDLIASIQAATVWEGHNSQSPRSHGIAIDLSSGTEFAALRPDYLNLAWAKSTSWDEWLRVAP